MYSAGFLPLLRLAGGPRTCAALFRRPRGHAVAASRRARPILFWPCGTQGQVRSVPVARKDASIGLEPHTPTTFWPCGTRGPHRSGPGARKASAFWAWGMCGLRRFGSGYARVRLVALGDIRPQCSVPAAHRSRLAGRAGASARNPDCSAVFARWTVTLGSHAPPGSQRVGHSAVHAEPAGLPAPGGAAREVRGPPAAPVVLRRRV